jgi:hypothetical protein
VRATAAPSRIICRLASCNHALFFRFVLIVYLRYDHLRRHLPISMPDMDVDHGQQDVTNDDREFITAIARLVGRIAELEAQVYGLDDEEDEVPESGNSWEWLESSKGLLKAAWQTLAPVPQLCDSWATLTYNLLSALACHVGTASKILTQPRGS